MSDPRASPCVSLGDGAFAASIASLGVGRKTVRLILGDLSPRQAWEAILSGNHPADPDGTLAQKADPRWPEMFSERLKSLRCPGHHEGAGAVTRVPSKTDCGHRRCSSVSGIPR